MALEPHKKIAAKAEKVKEKQKADMKKLAERGVVLSPGHTVRPGTLIKIMDIAKQISKGTPRLDILAEMGEKYGFDEKEAAKYYDLALTYLMPKDIEQHQEKMAAKLVSQYEVLYQKAVENNQIKTARDILDSLSKIYGLTGGNKVQIAENANGEKVINITFD